MQPRQAYRMRNRAAIFRAQAHRALKAEVAELEGGGSPGKAANALDLRTTPVTLVSFVAGTVGCVFLEGSLFALAEGMTLSMLALAILGAACWLQPWLRTHA